MKELLLALTIGFGFLYIIGLVIDAEPAYISAHIICFTISLVGLALKK